jgi:Uncharacterised protein family (UPF0236)
VAAETDRLAAVAARSAAGGAQLGALETAIRAAVTRLGASLLEDLLALDPGYRGPAIACGAGHMARFVSYRDKAIDTVLGPVTVRRAYYHCRECRHGVVPRDRELGTECASLSPGLRSMTAHAATVVPFAKATALLEEMAGVSLTVKRAERSAEADGAAARAAAEVESAAILARKVIPARPRGPLPGILYIEVDGTGVPMTPAETAGRPGKADDGRAHTREVKLACLFTQTRLDNDGRPVQDKGSASYLATFQPAEEFGALVAAEALRRGSDRIRQLAVIGDGAKWIWTLAAARFPEATQIVDLYHAREHLHDLAEHLAFIVSDPAEWRAERLAELDAGNIGAISRAARAYPLAGIKAGQLETKIGYFEANAVRMRYARFRDLGLFVGSGAVEGGCKNVIGTRLKQSGMRWSLRGADAITHLRCQDASGTWNQIWSKIHNQTDAA